MKLLCLIVVVLAEFSNVLTNGFFCNFDRNQCGFTQRKDDTFNWIRKRGSTSSGGTGPSNDVSGKGYYMYIEASGRNKGDNAKLEIKPGLSGMACVSFFYNMRGGRNNVGILRVLINGGEAFVKSGHQGNNWLKADITSNEPVSSVIFEGIVGRGYQSDIAIDEVTIETCGGGGTTAPPPRPQPSTEAPPPIPQTTIPPITGKCGIRPSTRIVGGEDSSPGDWPWQGMLTSSPNGPVFCGGSLVAPQWLVTASHCVKGASGSSIYVRLGSHKRREITGVEQDFTVSKIIMHPLYHKPIGMSHDIALLKLDRPVKVTRFVNLVCLPDNVSAPSEGKNCWITGWGRSHSVGGSSPNTLQQASVPIVGRNRCEWSYLGRIHDSMICAGLDRGGIDSCQGDSGGPMVCETGGRYYLQGVTSWGQGCARPNKYGVYARVKYVMKWLRQEMRNN